MVKANISKKLGNVTYSFEVEAETEFEALEKIAIFGDIPEECGLCKGKNVHLNANKAKGYNFVKVICRDCNGRAQLGSYKDGGYFWKSWEKYENPASETSTQADKEKDPL